LLARFLLQVHPRNVVLDKARKKNSKKKKAATKRWCRSREPVKSLEEWGKDDGTTQVLGAY
jgi:hypothetical protein